jgi:putative ABC transport system permease protein
MLWEKIIKVISIYEDNFKIALASIKTNKLRTVLTVSIIAFGIMSLVGILTAISSIENSLKEQFANMGSNTFKITSQTFVTHRMRQKGEARRNEPISYKDIRRFEKFYKFPSYKSYIFAATSIAVVKFKSKKTNPNITVWGIEGDYLKTSGNKIKQGRFFSHTEITKGRNVAIIGSKLKQKLFGNLPAIGSFIKIGDIKYKVVGIFDEKGSSMIDKTDNMVIIPLTTARNNFYRSNISYQIMLQPQNINLMKPAKNYAIIAMRKAKRLKPGEKNNFEIVKSDNLIRTLMKNLAVITTSTTIIGLITLFGAAIGLMNIMLVSVSERTREIGIRKAVGATPKIIRQQFLFESIFIGEIGGILGIILGILAGNLVTLIIGSSFVIPWLWILLGVLLTFIVGILSGLIPAAKAAKLDPIIALHYE